MLTKAHLVKATVLLVVVCRGESWNIKKAEHGRTNAFELWCWRRLLRVPWTARRSNQSILRENSAEYSLEGLMLKLKLQYFGHLFLFGKSWLTGKKNLDAGKDWRWEEKGMREDEMVRWHHQLDGHEFGQAPGVGDGQGSLACCSPWDHRVGHDWVTEQICKSGDYWLHLLVTSDINSIINHSLNIYWALFRYWNPAVNKGKTPALMNLPSSGKRSA